MRTGDVDPELSFPVPVASTILRYPSVFLPRLSWRFSEKYRTVSFALSPHKIPSDYEVMIVWTRPSTVLSESQVKKFAFSDPAEYSSHMASTGIQMSSPQGLAALVLNKNSFLENSPIHRIDMKSLCSRAMAE
jgi:hypothetical protein